MKRLLILLAFVPRLSWAGCSFVEVVRANWPDAQYQVDGAATGNPVFSSWTSVSPMPSADDIATATANCQAQQTQIAAWQLELSTTTAAVVSLGSGYVGANAITQVSYNAKLIRITQLRALLGLQ